MQIRKATVSDIQEIMIIIDEAKASLKAQAIDQWQDGYPNEAVINHDIAQGQSYVVIKDGAIVATFMLALGPDSSYKVIEHGNWLCSGDAYYVVHRIAVAHRYRKQGIAQFIFSWIEQHHLSKAIPSIRIDTHKENQAMQKLLLSIGFNYCGIIYLETKSPRLAYERLKVI
ncbi:MAG TPA: GNAT family N-acetyltransferase [Erysipelothrix sp.]